MVTFTVVDELNHVCKPHVTPFSHMLCCDSACERGIAHAPATCKQPFALPGSDGRREPSA